MKLCLLNTIMSILQRQMLFKEWQKSEGEAKSEATRLTLKPRAQAQGEHRGQMI